MHAKKSGVMGTVLVSTDNKDIAKVANNCAEVPFLRPKKLAGDLSTTEEFIKTCIDQLRKK